MSAFIEYPTQVNRNAARTAFERMKTHLAELDAG